MGSMTTFSRSQFFGLCALILILPGFALASEFRSGNNPTHPKNEALTGSLYLLGGSVSSLGAVKGDLIALGGTTLISGAVSGDIATVGGNISVLSDVSGDIRAGGGTINIQGAAGGDVLAGGGQVTIASSKVGGDVAVAGGVIRIDAPIAGNVNIVGGDIRIDSTVNGTVDVQAENITLGPNARIGGTFTYKSPRTATLESGAVVVGETKYTKSPDVREAAKLGLIAFFSIWFVAKMCMIFSGALVIGYVFERFSDEFVIRAMKRPLSEFGRGLVFFIVTPIVSLLLILTFIGIAFGILGLLAYASILILGTMLAPLVIGSGIHKLVFKQHEYEISWKTILTGTLVYFVVNSIPYVGGIITGLVTLIGIGAALATTKKMLSQWR